MATAPPVELESYLQSFGLSAFRPGQREVIETVLAGEDCLCVMPTGGGKSLCYQLPAIVETGLTLVVSPLIALMKDQVDQLTALGLPATFINSTLTPDEQARRLDEMAAGHYRLVYVVPERFRSPRFLDAVRRSRLRLLAVDEAHCVSEWGHDFRPDYARLGRFRQQIGNPPTIALTATATTAVQRDIVELLSLQTPKSFITGFARPNLHYVVRAPSSPREKDELLLEFLGQHPGSGIIYASTRKRCEEVAELVGGRTGRRTGIYHAGLAPDERRCAQEDFMEGRTEIVVATLAFGMGIDKANVRFVAHYNMPGSLEAYYQEAGRAGRDGQLSHCLLLYSPGDRYLHEFFIESSYPSREVVEQVYNLLCQQTEQPIELSQQDIKERLSLQIATDGVGACEKLLEQSGVLERLDAVENMAAVRLNSELPTLVELLPPQARVKRRVLRELERFVGPQRNEWVYFQPRELAARTEMEWPALARSLRELTELAAVDYVPAFRGRAIHMPDRRRPFASLGVDFETSERRKAAEYERLGIVVRYAQTRGCRQQLILHYFGEQGSAACLHCDNCGPAQGQASPGRTTAPAAGGVLEAVRIVLSGIARARGRCGKQLLAQMLCGSASEKVTRNRLDKLSTYGLLSHLKQTEVGELLEALIAARYIEQTDVDRFRPVLQLTQAGQDVMAGRLDRVENLSLATSLCKKLDRGLPGAKKTERAAPGPALPRQKAASPPSSTHSSPAPQRSPASQRAAAPALSPNDQLLAAAEPATDEEEFSTEPSPIASVPTPLSDALASNLPEEAAAAGFFLGAPDLPSEVASQPNHYWSWRLLCAGFSPAECAAIRGVASDVVLDHALRSLDSGWAVRAEWFLPPALVAKLEKLIGAAPPDRIRPLLARLPNGTRYEQVQLFVKCRFPSPVAGPAAAE